MLKRLCNSEKKMIIFALTRCAEKVHYEMEVISVKYSPKRRTVVRHTPPPPLSLSLQVLTVLVFWLVTWRNGTKSHYLTAATCPPHLPSFSRRVSPSPPVTYRQRVYYACETGYYYASGASDILVQECQQGGTLSMLNGECKGESIQFDLCIVKSTPSLQ